LRIKFQDMCAHKPPTGDPTIPEYIKNTKRIQRQSEERSNVDNLDGNLDSVGFEVQDGNNNNGEMRHHRCSGQQQAW
jgi:hypothetical protein